MDIFSGIGKSFEDLSQQVKDLGKRSIYEAKEASKATKLRIRIRELENMIAEQYRHLGEVYYMEMREQSHLTDSSSSELLLAIDELQKERAALQNQIDSKALDVEDLPMQCLRCGQGLTEGTNFCPNCGTKVESIPHTKEVPDFIECKNCHYETERGATYCPRCGAPMQG